MYQSGIFLKWGHIFLSSPPKGTPKHSFGESSSSSGDFSGILYRLLIGIKDFVNFGPTGGGGWGPLPLPPSVGGKKTILRQTDGGFWRRCIILRGWCLAPPLLSA